jgi:hypothetical protein
MRRGGPFVVSLRFNPLDSIAKESLPPRTTVASRGCVILRPAGPHSPGESSGVEGLARRSWREAWVTQSLGEINQCDKIAPNTLLGQVVAGAINKTSSASSNKSQETRDCGSAPNAESASTVTDGLRANPMTHFHIPLPYVRSG